LPTVGLGWPVLRKLEGVQSLEATVKVELLKARRGRAYDNSRRAKLAKPYNLTGAENKRVGLCTAAQNGADGARIRRVLEGKCHCKTKNCYANQSFEEVNSFLISYWSLPKGQQNALVAPELSLHKWVFLETPRSWI
jgi:hypothetical protein